MSNELGRILICGGARLDSLAGALGREGWEVRQVGTIGDVRELAAGGEFGVALLEGEGCSGELTSLLEDLRRICPGMVRAVEIGGMNAVKVVGLAGAGADLLVAAEDCEGAARLLAGARWERFLRAQGSAVSREHVLGLCFGVLNSFYPLLGRQMRRVVKICRSMSKEDCFSEEERAALHVASWCYDLGLISLRRGGIHECVSGIAEDSGELTAFRNHPVQGQQLVSFVSDSRLVGELVRYHHERFDGSGYPDGVAGERIPWAARCFAVAVAFVETGLSNEEAAVVLENASGVGFDPEAVRLFFRSTALTSLPRNVREVLLSELEPGMCLARGILGPSGVLLVPEGQELSPMLISRLESHARMRALNERILIYR